MVRSESRYVELSQKRDTQVLRYVPVYPHDPRPYVTPARWQRYMQSFSSRIHRMAWVSFPPFHFRFKYWDNSGETASKVSWIGILFRWQDLVVARLRERGKGFEVQLVETKTETMQPRPTCSLPQAIVHV